MEQIEVYNGFKQEREAKKQENGGGKRESGKCSSRREVGEREKREWGVLASHCL